MVNRILIARSLIRSAIKEVHPRVFYERALEAEYPYIIYELSDTTDDGSVEVIDLEIDGWDKPIDGSTVPLETMMGNVDNKLHRSVHKKDGVFFTIFRENRRTVEDSDERLRRRQYVYKIRMMGVGQ